MAGDADTQPAGKLLFPSNPEARRSIQLMGLYVNPRPEAAGPRSQKTVP